jgi:hypothetical protein
MTHPILTQCGDMKSEQEITRSRLDIEEALGVPCRHFAYPNGSYGTREVVTVRASGYVTARTTDPGWNGRKADAFRLRAFVVGDAAADEWLAVQAVGIPSLARAALASLGA